MIYDHAEGSKIEWKSEKDLTVKIETKKQRHKGTKETRTVKKTVPCDSFFNFFKPLQPPSEEEDEDDLPEDFEEKIEMDYEMGEALKEKIIPRAIDWFTGKALEHELYDEDEEGKF
jgi:nucleosome assembly protein 1-like 1